MFVFCLITVGVVWSNTSPYEWLVYNLCDLGDFKMSMAILYLHQTNLTQYTTVRLFLSNLIRYLKWVLNHLRQSMKYIHHVNNVKWSHFSLLFYNTKNSKSPPVWGLFPGRDIPKPLKQIHCQTLNNRCECHGSSGMTTIKGWPLSQYVRHIKDPSLLNGHEYRA